ncbi:hypothetical protein RBWH47_01129 [Rhodopirellula baltica WH47]|uniref:Uncharacterized protein n=1 Tax=Rhodopirellula baltica WH47 TaxID=991778 RepID=F2AR08_RHOBT|nr:hypothetical protein [Rhodopirellula baltica]EGF27886.1 hypothetical protein RBWH47_01129 [Rhodopirellula baltica WH47]
MRKRHFEIQFSVAPSESFRSCLEVNSVTHPDSNSDVRHSVGSCPICEQGLCSIRACGLVDDKPSHGLVVCDECEAIWLQPNIQGVHIYADAETPKCPIDQSPLYQGNNRWATLDDIDRLGWSDAVSPDLTYQPESDDS